MKRKLFVIGNGFDLHHNISSNYSDFASYLKREDRQTYSIAEEYVVPEQNLWSALEKRLAEVDVDQIEDYASNFLVSYGADGWSDSGHHDYEYEIENICDSISNKLRKHFADWVRTLETPPNSDVRVQCIDPGALFLNFNYTDTLQRLYHVPNSNVLHIHGSALDPTSEIVLGHGWDRQSQDLRSRFTDEDTDVRVAGGFELIDDLLARTFKPTQQIIRRNTAFFESLRSVTEVAVLGHSMASVDVPYFSEILGIVHPNANWTVSYRSDYSKTWYSAQDIGIPVSRLRVEQLVNL